MDKIMMIKDKVLDFMEQEVGKYGNARMDVKEIGELADVVKDLAEAEYYCSISKSMNEGQDTYGYTQPTGNRMGYGQGSSGGMNGDRAGYSGGMMGHSDPASAIRDILMTADPETKAMLRGEISKMLM